MLAFARLNAFVSGSCDGRGGPCQPGAHEAAGARESAVLYAGLATAYDLAGEELRRGGVPRPGEALDGFADAYASTYGIRDTPSFRRRLVGQLAVDPRIDRYWELTAEVLGAPDGPPEPTPGSAHDWLLEALGAQVSAVFGKPPRPGRAEVGVMPGRRTPRREAGRGAEVAQVSGGRQSAARTRSR